MFTHTKRTADGSDVTHASTGRIQVRSWLSKSSPAPFATAALLGACAATLTPTAVATTGGHRAETVREVRHIGPQGKSAPVLVNRQVQACATADGGFAIGV